MEMSWHGRAGCSPADTPDVSLPDPGADVLELVATRLMRNTWKATTGTTVQINRDMVKEGPMSTCRAASVFAIAGKIRAVKNPTK